jgi:methionine-rich copper-binding protein CopC
VRCRTRVSRRTAGVLGAAGLVVLLAVGPAAPVASAHNVLLSTTPAAGSTVAALPSLLVLHYDLPAQALGTVVIVRGPSGNVADGPAELINTDVDQPVRPGSPAGPYTVDWRVVSADGHVVQGSFGFTARAASTGSASPLPSAIRAGTIPTGSSGSSGVLLWVGIGAGVVVVVVVVLLVARGRTGRDEDDEDDED